MENVNISYKEFHERYMQNLNGTSCIETFAVVTPTSFATLFVCILAARARKSKACTNLHDFVHEFVVIIVTAIASFTIYADYVIHMLFAFIVLSCCTILYTIQDATIKFSTKNVLYVSLQSQKRSFVSNFRALTCILTAISILAVDFTVFPRRFAKTETFGFSLMDTGVGLFCVSNALVISSNRQNRNSSFIPHFIKTVRSCLPLLILGGIRLLSTKQMDYQVHVSEYGVHWNFFLTLAFSKLITSLILWVYDGRYVYIISLMIITIHEIILRSGVQDWVLNDIPRDNLFSANREGIVSLLGYVSIFIAGVGVKNLIFSESPKLLNYIILNIKFLTFSLFLWAFMLLCSNFFNTSRRLSNFGYYIWIITFSVSVLTLFITIDIVVVILKFSTKLQIVNITPEQYYACCVPIILEAVNFNGLAFFLIANLFTGLINLSIKTLTVSETYALLIIVMYMLLICSIMFWLFLKNIKLKVW